MRAACTAVTLLLLCLGTTVWAGQEYTAFNMWYEIPNKMSTVNYKRGTLIPAGTAVTNIRLNYDKEPLFPSIQFNRQSDGKEFRVFFRKRFHPGKSLEDYRKLMFGPKNFSALTAGMTEREINAILRGDLVTEMSKQAVVVAYGLPPQHQTSSLSSHVWRYWTSRLVSKNICFDQNDRTRSCSTNDSL